MKCRYFCRLPLDISPVYLTRGISKRLYLLWGFFLEKLRAGGYEGAGPGGHDHGSRNP